MKKLCLSFIAVFLIVFNCYAAGGAAEPNKAHQPEKTEVVIIGTIHNKHYTNPEYSPDVLKDIILALKPDAILNELPLSLVEPNGRPIERIRGEDNRGGPECWAADTVAQQLGIRQIPYDRPDRQENFKKTNYFERQKRANELANKWAAELSKNDPNSVDLKTAMLMSYAGQAEAVLFLNAGPQLINSDAHDSIIRIKHSVWHDIMPTILETHAGHKTLVDDYHFAAEQWQERNRIMADNIIKAAGEYKGKRLVVVTGATHRYILRDLLKNAPGIELKEYWEIIGPEVSKANIEGEKK